MKVLIVGFETVEQINNVMDKMIEDTGCYLFYVMSAGSEKSVAAEWAEKAGAPIFKLRDPDMKMLLRETDYLVMRVSDKLSSQWKNFLMQYKSTGKHGSVVYS